MKNIVFVMLILLPVAVFANEAAEFSGDSSWQFKNSNQHNADMNRLILQEQKEIGHPVSGSSSGNGSGTTIGNYTVIQIEGDNNSVDADHNQQNQNSNQKSETNY